MTTPSERAAETIGRAIDGRIFRLQEELRSLDQPAVNARRADIAAELADLQTEKARIDPRRPRDITPRPIVDAQPSRIR